MGRPRKPPAILVEATVRRSGKLAALPDDSARLGFFYVVLAEAKLADPPGQFASDAQFREVAGRFGPYLDDYLRVRILERAGKLCSRCAVKWASMPPRRGALVVHDWHDHQYDPRRLERQQAYDERQREADETDDDEGYGGVSDAISDGVSDPISDAQSEGFAGVSDGVSDADTRAPVRGPTRSRAANVERERRTENDESNQSLGRESQHRATDEQKNGSDGPRLTKSQLEAWRSFGAEWDDVKAAWLARGLRWPPSGEADDERSQRALLYEILDARPTDLVGWIRDAPAKLPTDELVGQVLAKWKAIKGDIEADADPLPWMRGRSTPEHVGDIANRVLAQEPAK